MPAMQNIFGTLLRGCWKQSAPGIQAESIRGHDLLTSESMSYGDLQGLLSSRVPLIVVESRDESRVLKLLQRACRRATAAAPAPTGSGAGDMTGNLGLGLPLFEWTITDGLRRLDTNGGAQRNLSILMAEKISALRRWAAERTVPAG